MRSSFKGLFLFKPRPFPPGYWFGFRDLWHLQPHSHSHPLPEVFQKGAGKTLHTPPKDKATHRSLPPVSSPLDSSRAF